MTDYQKLKAKPPSERFVTDHGLDESEKELFGILLLFSHKYEERGVLDLITVRDAFKELKEWKKK